MNLPAETLFNLVNLFILPAWFLLMLAPKWKWTKKIVLSGLYPMLYAGLYTIVLAFQFSNIELNFNSLENIYQLFSNPYVLLAGWIHYLSFDLFVGAWIVSDSQSNNIHGWPIIPILGFSFYLGPLGFLGYITYRKLRLSLSAGKNAMEN